MSSFYHSDIYSAYEKIMLEKQGKNLPSKSVEDKPKESKQLQKYRNDNHPRAGSDTLKVIENLYNTKPEQPKGQEYKSNIIEVAHPEKVILNNSYDKINALIENDAERQRIIINITQKPVNGQLTQHKYATSDLAQSLIAIANDLDNRNIEPLRKLADECIEELHKKANFFDDILGKGPGIGEDIKDVSKGVSGGAVLGGIAAGLSLAFGGPVILPLAIGAGVGGLLSSIFNTAPQAKNVMINAREAKEKLSDLMEDHKSDLFLTSLSSALDKVIQTTDMYSDVVDEMRVKSDDANIKRSAATVATAYQNQMRELDHLIDIFLSNAKMGRYAQEESDWLSKIKTPFTSIFGDKVNDAIQSFEVLEKVNESALQGIRAAQGQAMEVKEVVQSSPAVSTNPISTNLTPPEPGSAEWFQQMGKKITGQ